MNSLIKSFFKSSIIISITLIALGVLLIVQSEATIITISYVIGAILIALGVIAILNFFRKSKVAKSELDIIYGIVCIILGIVVIKHPEAIASIIPFVIGTIIIVNSATKLQYSIELKKEKNKLWMSTMALSIIMAVCGIVLIFNPFEGAILLTRIVGIFIVVYAVLDIISSIVIKNTYNQIHNAIQENIKDAEIIEEVEEKTTKKGKKKNDN